MVDSNSSGKHQHTQQSGSLGPLNNQNNLQAKDQRSSLTPSASNNPLSGSGRQALSSLPPSGKQIPLNNNSSGGRASGELQTNVVNQQSLFQKNHSSNISSNKQTQPCQQYQTAAESLDAADKEGTQLSHTSETVDSISGRLQGHTSNNRGGKRIQNEQLTQPLTSIRPQQLNTTTNATSGMPRNSLAVNDVPKKQRKFKDQDSSPGMHFRSGANQASTVGKTDSLRSNQKIFTSGQTGYQKRTTMKSSGLSASGGKGGPSVHISDMHKTSGSPSKAAKTANITYHQSVRSNNSQLDQVNSRSLQTSTNGNKKNSSRNSATLINAGKTMNPVLSASNAESFLDCSSQMTTIQGQQQQHPTSNINSIVMQTSPAKFLKNTPSHSMSLGSAQKTTCPNLLASSAQPEQPSINISNQFKNSLTSNTSAIRGNSGGTGSGSKQQDAVAIQVYGTNNKQHSGSEVQMRQSVTAGATTQQFQIEKNMELFSSPQTHNPASTSSSGFPSSLNQQPPQQKGKTNSMSATSPTGPSSNLAATSHSLTQTLLAKQQKHYSQVLTVNPTCQTNSLKVPGNNIAGGIPAKTEKTNSMSNLQQYHGTASAAASSAYGSAQFGVHANTSSDNEKQKKTQSGPCSSYGSTAAVQHQQWPINVSININNARTSTSPIRSMITAQTPQTGNITGSNNHLKGFSNHLQMPLAEPKTTSAAKSAGLSGLAPSSGPKGSNTGGSRAKKELGLKQSKRNSNANTNVNTNLSFSYTVTSQGSQKQLTKKQSDSKSTSQITLGNQHAKASNKLSGSGSKLAPSQGATNETLEYSNLKRVLLKGNSMADFAGPETGRLQSQKSSESLTQIRNNSISSQVVVPAQIGLQSNKAANQNLRKTTNNIISPRQQQMNGSVVIVANQNMKHNQTISQHNSSKADQEANKTSTSILSEEIRSVDLDMLNQNVIRADTERARFINKEQHSALQSMLTFFCKSERISYKQGINDIMAPFLWLSAAKNKSSDAASAQKQSNSAKKKKSQQLQQSFTNSDSACQFDLEEPYVMAREFIHTFQTNMFLDDDFNALQSCLALVKILLFYHDPVVAKHLENCQVTPELYCIPWFITYFAARMETAQLVLEFWDRVVQGAYDSSITFIFFFAVALITTHRDSILNCDLADLPQLMASLSVNSQPVLSSLIRTAEELEDNTPYSFRYLDELRSLYVKQSTEKLKQISQNLEQFTCMPIQPAEMFFYGFPGEIDCPNPACSDSLTWRRDRNNEYLPLGPTNHMRPSNSREDRARQEGGEKQINQGVNVNVGIQPFQSESDERAQSGLSSFANSFNSGSQVIQAAIGPPPNLKKCATGGHPLETESNLNYEQDHQESPIDLINETTKMKHLSSEDFKSFGDQAAHGGGSVSEISSDRLQIRDNPHSAQETMPGQVAQTGTVEAQLPELCLRCQQRQRVVQQLEEKREPARNQVPQQTQGATPPDEKTKDTGEASFEDLSTDLLYNKFRFVIVDCRLNILQNEVALPHCLSLEVLAASQANQLKNQIASLLDYKDSYHVCLLGLDKAEQPVRGSQPQVPHQNSQPGKISIRQFHESVLCLVTTELIRQGFKYVSTLPSGFQEVHDLAQVYGFQLIDHDDAHATARQSVGDTPQVDKDGLPIDCPITVSIPGNCYHCLASRNRRRTLEHQNSMVVKKYGSMVNTLGGAATELQAVLQDSEIVNFDRMEKSAAYDEMTLRTGNTTQADEREVTEPTGSVQETTAYQGQKFDLIGFSEYFPFGLKQVYAAASSINQMLQSSKPEEEEQKAVKQFSPKKTVHSQNLSAIGGPVPPSKKGKERSLERLIGDMSRSRLRHVNIGASGTISRQQSTEHAYVGSSSGFHQLAPNNLTSGLVRSAGKSSEATNRKAATISGQPSLQQNYKLHSKVPDFKSQFLISKDQTQRVAGAAITQTEIEAQMRETEQQMNVNPSFVRLNNSFQAQGAAVRSESASVAQPLISLHKLSDYDHRRGSRLQQESVHDYDRLKQQQFQRSDAHSQNRISQLLVNQRELGRKAEFNQNASPIRRNRPRIINEVQSSDKDIAQMLQKMQQQQQRPPAEGGEATNEQPGPIMDENVPSKNVNRMNLGTVNVVSQYGNEGGMDAPHFQPNVANSQAVMSFQQRRAEECRSQITQQFNKQQQQSATDSYHQHQANQSQSSIHQSQQQYSRINQNASSSYNASSHMTSDVVNADDLPVFTPIEESYLLNGIVKQVTISPSDFDHLLARYDKAHLFHATRMPTRKRQFQLGSQLTFHLNIDSYILITPYTVAIIQKTDDIRRALRHQNNIQESQLNGELMSQFAVLQSRFFMYDLIKITSRKSTTKIITFYYRIPKKSEYDEKVLEDKDIIWNLNTRPQCHYVFAFKRPEFEEVSMSFEFEREEDAKKCINSVSSLYKQLKESTKSKSKKSHAHASAAVRNNNNQPTAEGPSNPNQ